MEPVNKTSPPEKSNSSVVKLEEEVAEKSQISSPSTQDSEKVWGLLSSIGDNSLSRNTHMIENNSIALAYLLLNNLNGFIC